MPPFESRGAQRIFRCGGTLLSRTRRQVASTNRTSISGIVAAGLHAVHSATWKRIYWPDKACTWIVPAVRQACRLLEKQHYDSMISVALPFSAHVAAMGVKRRYPGLHWLADCGDPFAFQDDSASNNARLYSAANRRWERRVVAAADRVSVTTDATRNLYANAFPESAGKISVIPPLIGSDVQPSADLRTVVPGRLLFLGTLYSTIRNPGYLLALFQALQQRSGAKYELHFMGDAGNCLAQLSQHAARDGSGIHIHGKQSRDAALNALNEADVVINLGNTHAYQLPSKLVEYAAAGKRILNLAPCADDSSTAFLRAYPLSLTLQQTAVPLNADVDAALRFLESPSCARTSATEHWLCQFRTANVAQQYLRQLSASLMDLPEHVETVSLPAALSA